MSIYGNLLEDDGQNFLQTGISSERFSDPDAPPEIKKRVTHEFERKSSYRSIDSRTSITEEPRRPLPEITDWRRAAAEDMKAIRRLQVLTGDVASLLYKRKNIDDLIKTSYISIVQFDSEGNLISFTAYDCYPNIPALPAFWKDWLFINYRLEGIDARNVLFIHYMVWQPEQADKFLPLLLKTLFTEFLYLKYIIVIKPPNADVPKFYARYFIPVLPPGLEEFECHSLQLLLLCLRSSIVHPLPIRNVLGQDLEVAMSLLRNRLNKDATWDLVNFVYEKNKKTLICEKGGHMTGVMVLNLTIDLDVLNEGFDLTPFNGLRKNIFEDEEFGLPSTRKKSFAVDMKSNISIAESKLAFPNITWDDIDELEETDMTDESTSSASPISSVSFSFYRSISQFSLLRLGSIIEVKKGEEKVPDTLTRMEDIDVVINKSESTISHFFPPKYFGPVNAFIIDFFALDSRMDEKLSSFDFLEAAFRVVPDRDYCILLIPTDLIPFPLMDLFVRVTPKIMTSIKQELYLFHKNLLSVNSIAVRQAKIDDLPAINYFLKDVDEGGLVFQDFINENMDKKKDPNAFILTVEEAIVGVSLMNSQVEQFHMYYETSDIIPSGPCGNDSHSVIKHLILNPIYHNHAHFFVRDIMRLVDVNCIFYTHRKPYKGQRNLLTVLGEFCPVHPKKKGKLMSFYEGDDLSDTTRRRSVFSLYFLTSPLCGFQKIHLNIVIVVVGASRTALSFLESLIYGPASYLYKYNNLICVTPQDLKSDSEEENLRDLMFPVRDNFSRAYISMLSLEAFVNFIYGIMTAINRSEKYIVINNKTIIRYDYLILTCGLQYLTPKSKTEQITIKNCRNTYRSSLARYLRMPDKQEEPKASDSHHPNNMFIINTSKDAQIAIRSLQPLMQKLKTIRKNDRKIVVYGRDLQVYLTIHTLLKLGIPGEFIVFVEPTMPPRTVTLFNDLRVDQAVTQTLIDNKINYYTEYDLYDWSLSSEENIISIKFHSKFKQIDIPCLAFFPFVDKLVSDVTFNACNNAGLVYDGRLVINHNFRTNDRYVYAAGSFTKYARRYFANNSSHQYYSSREVGQKLAAIIRKLIDPTTHVKKEENSELVPKLTAPIQVYCKLPGDFNLFMLRKPGKELDLETAYNFADYGDVLTTGDCEMKCGIGYFRLHLNAEGFVESVTCYTKDTIDYVNLSCLYGLHEKILNNLVHRFDLATINDFFEYFRQPWALALFHDNFQSLRDYNYKAFFQKTSDDKVFFDKVVEQLEMCKWEELSIPVLQELGAKYKNSKIHEDIKDNLMQFLEYYKNDLPVYATNSRLKKLLEKNKELSSKHQN